MTIISWLFLLFAGILYFIVRFHEIQENKKQNAILRLELPRITSDIEQVIEKTANTSKSKLLFDSRYIRYLYSSPSQDSHIISFPIMLDEKVDTDTEGYLTQVFLTQFNQFLNNSQSYVYWSDKGKRLQFTYQFGELLRYNNQYYLNLQISFSYQGV
ncbi:RNA-binding protein [Streptococcus suis]|uniref:RNA-binding protein n=1 Tax=Streptococcus suis TaxID=1307 RepID=A0A9X4MMD4_STRSU|nr:RNA-binding protein [Streptococcus suis]MDG4516341.1 RNA-binding protein [Streptococcus suis]MDG4523228.1 RNA-binding protein [Streptococcus suis]HEL1995434.1 RNA-binding protein [Streptococcus suis]